MFKNKDAVEGTFEFSRGYADTNFIINLFIEWRIIILPFHR